MTTAAKADVHKKFGELLHRTADSGSFKRRAGAGRGRLVPSRQNFYTKKIQLFLFFFFLTTAPFHFLSELHVSVF